VIDLAESARHTRLHLRFWLPLARGFGKVFLACFGPVRNHGSYRVPSTGGVLILVNHLSDVDPIVLHSCCPRAVHFMGKSELFDIPVVGRIMRSFGAFPVNRGAPDRAALKLSASLLKDGEAVCVFPEGQLSEDGNLQEIRGGVALIIRLAPGIPVICCSLSGTDRVLPYGKLIPRPAFRTVNVTWGEPRTFDKSTSAEEILGWVAGQFRELVQL
jgi:1-acyl-sn-glycerol-3-phosphate acyltransferase